jgi:predicted nucleotidyltransferase component of viral defense system
MKRGAPKNIAVSVRDRIAARSRERGEDFQFLLQRYAAERFLYRLGLSAHRSRFILKGAMLFALWGGPVYRPTRDLDFTGYGSADTDDVLSAFRDVCALSVDDDGLVFDLSTLSAAPIRGASEYHGLRVKMQSGLAGARIDMQMDIGFGNAIHPPAVNAEYPTLLDMPAPRIMAYPQEAVVAEKLHAIAVLGAVNSRYKDFYDLYALARQFSFKGGSLSDAISSTFKRRRTEITAVLPIGLTAAFYADADRAVQWRAYINRNKLPGATQDFAVVGELIQSFLSPIWSALVEGKAFNSEWTAGGPWKAVRLKE